MALTQLNQSPSTFLLRPITKSSPYPAKTCSECNGHLIQTPTGRVCDQCGLVHDPIIYESELYPVYGVITDPNPPMIGNIDNHNSIPSQFTYAYDPLSLSGYIHPKMDIFTMETTHPKRKDRFYYLSRINANVNSNIEFIFYRIWDIIIKVHQYIPLSTFLKRDIIYQFKKIQNHSQTSIPNSCHLLACCVYYCLNNNRIEVLPETIITLFCELGHSITPRTFRCYQREYNLIPPIDPNRFILNIQHWCNTLFPSSPEAQRLTQVASDIYRSCLKDGINRMNLAAASIYAAVQLLQAKYNVALNLSQARVGILTNKSREQIQTTYKKYIFPRIQKLYKKGLL